MKQAVREAFLAVRESWSSDVVIASPDLNQKFIDACRVRNLAEPSSVLNLCLLNMRKTGALQGIHSKRAGIKNQEEYRFASEVAIRFLERRDQETLDQILCDPVRAASFDDVARGIAPGFSSFQYRWAALNLRKRNRLRPEILAKVVAPESVITCSAIELKVTDLPTSQGLYLLIEPSRVLYIGECQNLRHRVTKHLDHSDNKGLAHWLWQHGATNLHVEYHVLPAATPTRVRKALETELIRSRNPVFNVAGVEDQS
jgi:hypothetical protein